MLNLIQHLNIKIPKQDANDRIVFHFNFTRNNNYQKNKYQISTKKQNESPNRISVRICKI